MAAYFLGEDMSESDLLTQMRKIRHILLGMSDWSVLPDTPTDKTTWTDYRQQLRDFPATWIPASVVDFPDPPEQ